MPRRWIAALFNKVQQAAVDKLKVVHSSNECMGIRELCIETMASALELKSYSDYDDESQKEKKNKGLQQVN